MIWDCRMRLTLCGSHVRPVRDVMGLDQNATYVVDRVRSKSIRLKGSPWWYAREDFVVVGKK